MKRLIILIFFKVYTDMLDIQRGYKYAISGHLSEPLFPIKLKMVYLLLQLRKILSLSRAQSQTLANQNIWPIRIQLLRKTLLNLYINSKNW